MALNIPGPLEDKEYVGSWFAVELDNGVKGTFTDISGARLARICADGLRAVAQISDYASSHRGKGGSSVGDRLRA